MKKLKVSEIATVRLQLLQKNSMRCALCSLPCSTEQAVLDHCHSSGLVRDTLHRSCNALLGKVENNFKRYGVSNLSAFLHGCVAYLQRHETPVTDMIHPTHKTADEKRLARNAKAKKARAAKKATA